VDWCVDLPALAGVVMWVLVDLTTSVASCQNDGRVGVGAAAGWALVLVPPVLTAAAGRQRLTHGTRLALATLTSAGLTLFFVTLATTIWTAGHACSGSLFS
jgi:hypothetical protein